MLFLKGVPIGEPLCLFEEENLDNYLKEDDWTKEKPKAVKNANSEEKKAQTTPKPAKSAKKVTFNPHVETLTKKQIDEEVTKSELELVNDLFANQLSIHKSGTTDTKELKDQLVKFIISFSENNDKFGESVILGVSESCKSWY
ncbi:hypothetical protein RF11_02753 [Thelohanellus kitauei]|uniref:Uncharacterized protein n=1 Tax=Thelohanellus kitauei TaxID=669202 RepID=A0A0C2J8B8_THEKT|nr:hypothetical protein RF11_02753 [Thelohanellus kitauei]